MIKIENLSLTLNKNIILNNINLQLGNNKIIAIIGKNASGKSSLIKCINETYKYEGNIYINNKNIKQLKYIEKATEISILPQLLTYPHIKVYDLIAKGRNPYLNILSKLKEEDVNIINKIIKELKIDDIKYKYLDELSGGQRQIVYLAMMLVQNTNILILDEPTTFMDITNENLFMETLNLVKCSNNNKTIIIALHNINNVIKYADDIVVLDKGEVVFSGSKQLCLDNKIIEEVFKLKKYVVNNNIIFSN